MSQLRAVERVTLAEQVAVQIAEMIGARRWNTGEKLPPEADLCAALNVGRSTLREALKSLAFIGMVRMRPGDGTYVAEPSRGILHRILAIGLLKTEKDLGDVCETRMILETELAALAAERATTGDVELLERLIAKGGQILNENPHSYTEVDLEFHLAIARASQNKLLPHILTGIRALLFEWIAKSQEVPGLRENAHEQHKRIFQVISERDPEAARKEMHAHLEAFQRAYKLLGRLPESEDPLSKAGQIVAAQAQFSDLSSL